jgi:hypothetical protein
MKLSGYFQSSQKVLLRGDHLICSTTTDITSSRHLLTGIVTVVTSETSSLLIALTVHHLCTNMTVTVCFDALGTCFSLEPAIKALEALLGSELRSAGSDARMTIMDWVGLLPPSRPHTDNNSSTLLSVIIPTPPSPPHLPHQFPRSSNYPSLELLLSL